MSLFELHIFTFMKITTIDYNNVSALSYKDLSYINLESYLTDYYRFQPSIEGFAEAINERLNKPVNRDVLVDNIKHDYSAV